MQKPIHARHVGWVVGSLILIIVLATCQRVTDRAADSETVEAPFSAEGAVSEEPSPSPEAEQAGEDTGPTEDAERTQTSPESVDHAYQEGFTDQGEPFRGDPNAPVVIEEFSSYQCPYCTKYFLESYPKVVSNHVETGQVLYIFRDFPLRSQPQSPLASEAANCAGRLGGGSTYWMMHDWLFERQTDWSGQRNAGAIFEGYANELGLDPASFGECLNSGATRSQVEADAAEGGARGVRGTPAFFINDQPLVGAQPYAVIARAIEAALTGEVPAATQPSAPVAGPTPAAIAPADGAMVLGDPGAPVTIVEFSDYECGFCSRHVEKTWPRIQTEFVNTGRARYVFKDFPIAGLHPQAFRAHEAARCAGEQGTYWAMHDQLFAEQPSWAGRSDNASIFESYAAKLGLDAGAFGDCLASGQSSATVDADIAEGASLGVRGTPTFFIDGFPLVGAQPYETFRFAIELAEQGKLGEAFRPQP